MFHHPMSDEEFSRAEDLHRAGLSARDIASRLGYSISTVRRRLQPVGAYRRRQLTGDIREEIIAEYEAGKSVHKIFDEIGFSRKTITAVLVEAGVYTPSARLDWTDDRLLSLCREMNGAKASLVEIAARIEREFGQKISPSTVSSALYAHGIRNPVQRDDHAPAGEPAPVKDHVRLGDFTIRKAWQATGIEGEPIPPVSVSAGMERCA